MANCMATLHLILALCAISASGRMLLPVNVDCGTTGKTIGFLKMAWVGDEEHVKTGLSATIRTNLSLIKPLMTLRYFPSGRKNCYSFPGVGTGKKILVRAWFLYQNYDGLESPPTFDLLFNGNPWGTVLFSTANESKSFEMVYFTKVDDVSVCLARTKSSDVPFINSLEIKQLEDNMYGKMDTDRPLYVQGRYAYASASTVRYPDDRYDRIWDPFTDYASYGVSPVTRSSDPLSTMADRPPAAVLRQAITLSSSLASNLTIPNQVSAPSLMPHYVTFYFVEMLPKQPNVGRSFDMYMDNERFFSEPIVPNGTVKEVVSRMIALSTSSVFSLIKAKGSKLPPLISAAEFFRVGDIWTVFATDSSDVKALSELQKNYVQLQAWSGDPCLPIAYAWDWVNCTADSTPRVTALYLSSYGLTGPLANFSSMTALQMIDLHNNSLSGSIPEFLGKLPSLMQLNLADNQFSGSLPPSLTSNSKLNLNVLGNNMSGNSSESVDRAEKKTNKGVIAGATIGSLSLFLLVILAIFIFEKQCGNAAPKDPSGRNSTYAFLTWEGRLRIALRIATGLDYLHSGCSPLIIHRDVKTTNILLNEKMEAKLADFGLSKVGKKDDVTQLSTVVAGTPGYIDPEYFNTNMVTKKSDVYSFGVVLFELITGRPPLFDAFEKRIHVVQWATTMLVRGDIDDIADPKLSGQYHVNSMQKVADIATLCTSQQSHSRPHMSNVVDQLKEAMEIEICSQ